jgi:hypothetical protein
VYHSGIREIVMDLLLGLAGLAGLAALLQSKVLPTEKEYEKAVLDLAANPDDPKANLVVGKYKTFVQDDFQFGLQHLAKGSDKTLAALAQKELDVTNTDTPEKQVGMGDEWVIAAKKFPPLTTQFYDHASEWYIKAWPRLTDLWKMKVREQGRKLAASRPAGPKKATATNWTMGPGCIIDGTIAHTGSYSVKLPEKNPKTPEPEFRFISDPITVIGKKTFEMSAYALSDLTENPLDRFFVHVFNTDGVNVGPWVLLIQNDVPVWKPFYMKKDIPPNIVYVRLGSVKFSKDGNIWTDDFSVKIDGVEVMKNGSFEQR